MDLISLLPDEIISKILSFLPTKDVMRTIFLSKRWKSIWILVPSLEFDEATHPPSYALRGDTMTPDYRNFRRFLDRSLMSRASQVLQSLYLRLNGDSKHDDDVQIWLGTAVKLGLKELNLQYCTWDAASLPKSLYTCETLVILRLENVGLDVPDHVCLSSLKTLTLKSISYSNANNAFLRLLPNCPVLEDLFLHRRPSLVYDLSYKIIVPSLKRLSLFSNGSIFTKVVVHAPLLKSLQIIDRSGSLSFGEMNISEVFKANIDVILKLPEKLLHSLASVVHLLLCLSASEVVYPDGCCFHRLKHLEVCTCKPEWLLLFMRLLQDSPFLKVIKINQCHPPINPRPHQWNQPGSVPRCLCSNLEVFEWIKYKGTQYEKELSTYILKTAVFLKKASFTARSDDYKEKLQMLQELSFSRRTSSTCEIVFK